MPKAEPVQLSLLGRFAIRAGGTPPSPIRISSQKGRALLAYLAMQRGQSISRERLSTLLWGDRFDTRARHNLRQCLLTLRADLGPVASDLLILAGDELCLRTELVTVDAVEFEALAKSTELPDLERAAALYRGEFLAEFTIETEAFDDWVRAERARLEAIAARVLETCAEQLDAIGDGERAIEAAERLTALDPLREDWQRRQMFLYARYRSREDALAHGRSITALLKSELNVGPEPATTALIDEIKRGAVAPTTPTHPALAEAPAAGSNLVQPDATAAMAMREQPRGHATSFRPIAGMAFVALACIAGTVGFFLLSREGSKPVDSGTPTTPSVSVDQAAIDQSWRSPSILAGVAVDKAALAGRGLIPIVVLPFRTYGDHGSDQMVAEQITDDLISDLSRTPSLRVISGQTSRLYRGRPIDVAAVGAELGVRYVVEGGVRTDGDLLRINVDLVDTTTRLQAWSDRFEREKSERFAIQNEITRGLARRLQVETMRAEGRRSVEGSREPDVVNLLGKGWAAVWHGHSAGTMGEAEANFEEVLKRDPDNLSGLVGLAAQHIIAVGNLFVSDREPRLARAEELLTQAINKQAPSSTVYYYFGVLHKFRGKSDPALEFLRKALELNPSHPSSYAQVGSVLIRLGRFNEALEHIRYAIRLSPKDPALTVWTRFAGQAEIELGRDEAAIEWLRQSVALGPTQPWNQASLAAGYALMGNKVDATKHMAEIKQFAPWALDRIREEVAQRFAKGPEPPRFWQGLRKALAASSH